jgi:hypothetical protein
MSADIPLFSSLTAPKVPRSQLKTQRSSAPCYHTFHRSCKFLLFSEYIKISGAYLGASPLENNHFLLTYLSPPPITGWGGTTSFRTTKRLPRATATQASSRLNQKIFHLPDGPAQCARDDAMRAAMACELEGKPIPDGNPNQWADKTKNGVQFDYDAYAEVERCHDRHHRRPILSWQVGRHGGVSQVPKVALRLWRPTGFGCQLHSWFLWEGFLARVVCQSADGKVEPRTRDGCCEEVGIASSKRSCEVRVLTNTAELADICRKS